MTSQCGLFCIELTHLEKNIYKFLRNRGEYKGEPGVNACLLDSASSSFYNYRNSGKLVIASFQTQN